MGALGLPSRVVPGAAAFSRMSWGLPHDLGTKVALCAVFERPLSCGRPFIHSNPFLPLVCRTSTPFHPYSSGRRRALPLSPVSAAVAGEIAGAFCRVLPVSAGVNRCLTGLPFHPVLPQFCRRLLANSTRFCRSAAFTRLLRDHFFFFFGASAGRAPPPRPHPRLGEHPASAPARPRQPHRGTQRATPHRWRWGDAGRRWHDQALTVAANRPARRCCARALVCTAGGWPWMHSDPSHTRTSRHTSGIPTPRGQRHGTGRDGTRGGTTPHRPLRFRATRRELPRADDGGGGA